MDKSKKSDEPIFGNGEPVPLNKNTKGQSNEQTIACNEFSFQNNDKEKCEEDLIIANNQLDLQNEEKKKRAAELFIANNELDFQNEEKEKRAAEFIIANRELKKTEEYLKEYIQGLEQMVFMISHKIRRPIANILGLANVLDLSINSPDELKKLVKYIKQSALSLDFFTTEMSIFMSDLESRRK